MSFMVLNTGRVASQFFYINLKIQSDIIMPSRYEFDYVVKSFLKRRYKSPLYKMKKKLKMELIQNPNAISGIVFHSLRRNLIYPLNSKRNVDFLKACQNILGIKVIFFPVRDLNAVYKSELNRQLARIVGDWSFPNTMNGWRYHWKMNHYNSLKTLALNDNNCFEYLPKKIIEDDLQNFSRKFIVERAKIYSLYKLYSNVFNNVKIFDYSHLFNSPDKVFEKMGKVAGFKVSNPSMIKTRLNGLANRFMLYNGFSIRIDMQTLREWKKKGINTEKRRNIYQNFSLKKIMMNDYNPFLLCCRFKFEIPEVIRVCEDWGQYQKLITLDDKLLPSVVETLGSKIAIGVQEDDKKNFSNDELNEMLKYIIDVICPRFNKNFEILMKYYKNYVYEKDLKQSNLYSQFKKENQSEYNEINKILNDSDFLIN